MAKLGPESYFFGRDPESGNNVLLEDFGDRIEIRYDLGRGFDDARMSCISHVELKTYLLEIYGNFWSDRPLIIVGQHLLSDRKYNGVSKWM